MYPVVVLLFALGLQGPCDGNLVKSNIVSFNPGGSKTFKLATMIGSTTVWYNKLQGYGLECAEYHDHGFGTLIYFGGDIVGEAHVQSCEMDQIARYVTIQSYQKCHHHVEVCLITEECKTHDIVLSAKCSQVSLKTLKGSYECVNAWCQVERDDSGTLVTDVYGSEYED